jgi:hypothetical protein
MAVQTPPSLPPASDQDGERIEAGVIEDARLRQRRQRRVGAALAGAGVIIAGLIIGFSGGGGGSGGGRHSGGNHGGGAGAGGHAAYQAPMRNVLNPAPGVPSLQQLIDNFAVLRRPANAADRSWHPFCGCGGTGRQIQDLTRFAVKLAGGYRVFLDVVRFNAGGAYVLSLTILNRAADTSSYSYGPNVQYAINPISFGGERGQLTEAPGSKVFASIVPDGVARVSWTFGCVSVTAEACAGVRPRTFAVPVINNVAAARLAGMPSCLTCTHPDEVVWRAADGRVITSFSGYGNLVAPPFVSGTLGSGTKRLLSSRAIGSTQIGQSASSAIPALTRQLGTPAYLNARLTTGCGVDHETIWQSPAVADPLTVYERNGRFVGYQYGAPADRIGLKRGPGAALETQSGLALGDTIGTAKRLYPNDFATKAADNLGYWSEAAGSSKLSGSAIPTEYPVHKVVPKDFVATIDAGVTACDSSSSPRS